MTIMNELVTYAAGEHGDSKIPLWTSATVGEVYAPTPDRLCPGGLQACGRVRL
jgi:hypothetical protein